MNQGAAHRNIANARGALALWLHADDPDDAVDVRRVSAFPSLFSTQCCHGQFASFACI
jgi:hypothetical protein